MAIVEKGVGLLSFGTTTVAGFIIESIDEITSGEDVKIADENGDIVTDISNFMVQTPVDITAVPKVATVAPEIGDIFTYTSETHGASIKGIVKEFSPSSNNKDITRWSIKLDRYPTITL